MPAGQVATQLRISEAADAAEITAVRTMFRRYAGEFDYGICFVSFEDELARLPGAYARPAGALLVAWIADQPVGCVALRRLEERSGAKASLGSAEMKRLYVAPEARGRGAGFALVQRAIEVARGAGYSRILLETLPDRMREAHALYTAIGFREIAPYGPSCAPQARCLELPLG
jgi:GNAT superfamily N-acetyltransferase